MKLYQGNLSPFAARVRMQVYAKALAGEEIEICAPPGGSGSAEYKAINPTGKIPALAAGTRVIPESEVICEYLEDVFPAVPLRPASAEARAQVRLLSRFVDLYLYPRMSPLYPHVNPAVRDDGVVAALLPVFDDGMDILARMLADGGYRGGAHAVGDELTLADCALVPGLFFVDVLLPALGRANAFANVPSVGSYYRQAVAQPAAARVVAEMQIGLREMRA